MVMDILLLMIMVLTIFFCMRIGFAMSVVGFFKGFVSLIIAWIFCDDLAAWLIKSTPVGTAMSGKINEGLSAKWENSDIYMALPDLFKEGKGVVAQGKLQNGVFVADQVLAKHDENYMPPEAEKAVQDAQKKARAMKE